MKKYINRARWSLLAVATLTLFACVPNPQDADYDVIIRGGSIYDGLGGDPVISDLAIDNDRIAIIGDLANASGGIEIDAEGLAVAPGFINMLSWATESLIEDNASMRADKIERQGDIKYDIEWTTLGDYLEFLEAKGISPNVASYVGATTLLSMRRQISRVQRS